MQGNWLISTDNLIRVLGLKDPVTGAFVNTATVTGTLKDGNGAAVSGGSVTFAYLTGSNGVYYGYVANSVTLVENAEYTLEITIAATVGGGSRQRLVKLTRQAKYATI